MVLESTIICVDNSEYMRNGDFTPTRLQAQQDAVNLLFQCKIRSHPENGVGVLAMADRVEVLTTMTQDNGKVIMKLHQIQMKGESNFLAGIRVAHLALKHRQNRQSRTRIILFVGSPMDSVEQAELVKLAKKLKKEKVNVDIVCFGEADSENADKLNAFIETLNGRDGAGNSNLVVVPAGGQLTEALVASPICRNEDGTAPPAALAAAATGVGGGGPTDFGIDPNDDPELAMALRVSLEEQRQRQEQEARARQQTEAGEAGSAAIVVDGTPSVAAAVAPQPMDTTADRDMASMTEEEQLAWALRMSMQSAEGSGTGGAQPQPMEQDGLQVSTKDVSTDQSATGGDDDGDDDEEEEEGDDGGELGALMADPAALQQLVASLPGVDPNSQIIKDAISSSQQQTQQQDKKKKDEKKESKDESEKK